MVPISATRVPTSNLRIGAFRCRSGLGLRGFGRTEQACDLVDRGVLGARVGVQVLGCGLEVGVAEEFLDGADVDAIAENVGRKGVAQRAKLSSRGRRESILAQWKLNAPAFAG